MLEIVRQKPAKELGSTDLNDLSDERDSSPAVMLRKNDFNSSTKLTALSEDLREMRALTDNAAGCLSEARSAAGSRPLFPGCRIFTVHQLFGFD